MRVALAVIILVTACSSSPSSQCKDVCRREAECAEELGDPNFKVDQDECSSVCTALERDGRGAELVDEHVACVAGADTCEAVFACSAGS